MPNLAEFLACLCNYNKMHFWNNTKRTLRGCWNLASKILWFSRFSRFHIHFQGFANLRQIQGFSRCSRFSRLAINPVPSPHVLSLHDGNPHHYLVPLLLSVMLITCCCAVALYAVITCSCWHFCGWMDVRQDIITEGLHSRLHCPIRHI